MGRALGNNLINLTAYQDVKEALEEMGIDLNAVEDQEPDAALGMVDWDVLQPAFWTLLLLLAILHMDAGSVIITECSNKN